VIWVILKIIFHFRPQSNIISQWHCRHYLGSVRVTADSTTVCKLCTKTPRCHCHRSPVVGSINDIADKRYAVSMTPLTKYDTNDQWASKFDMLWLFLKEISILKNHTGPIVLHYIYIQYSYEKEGG
jgi:hypothetical protein